MPTGHDAGLTSAALGLFSALDQRGVDVGFVKPIAQPGEYDPNADDRSCVMIRKLAGIHVPAPLSAAEVEQRLAHDELDDVMEQVMAAVLDSRARHELVVVEGLAPSSALIYSSQVNRALAAALDADVVLVANGASADPATIADTARMTALGYQRGEESRVVGCLVNRVADAGREFEPLRAALQALGVAAAGAVPYVEELTWPRMLDLVRLLDAGVLQEGDLATRRLKDVAVFARAIPGALDYLVEGRLVVVPGDRHDIIMAAALAEAGGVKLAGLLLSGDVSPDPQVFDLARRAAGSALPILTTGGDTFTTASKLHDIDRSLPGDDLERAKMVMRVVSEHLDEDWLAAVRGQTPRHRVSPAAFRFRLAELARAGGRRIVLPEGDEPRTIRAAVACLHRGLAGCVLLGDPDGVRAVARAEGLGLPDDIEIILPDAIAERYLGRLLERRAHRGLTEEQARDMLGDSIVVGTLMLDAGDVDGLVAGAQHTTAATLRPALQLISTAPGFSLVSSCFFMCLPDDVVVYADCAVNPDPNASQLAEIAVQSAASARAFGIQPRVAMISYATGDSSAGAAVDKVAEATRLARELAPDVPVDGPMQYDAAAIRSVAQSKRPGSEVAGQATVFVFPDLNTGNTIYKAVQRGAGVVSIGPVLQGLAKPVNDLSRGAQVEDIIYTIAVTAIQAAALHDVPVGVAGAV
ncbi:MAG: phosphate acetyltransferase [Gaiellales bacterium]